MLSILKRYGITLGYILLLIGLNQKSLAADTAELSCDVDGSRDFFELYTEQLSFQGADFWHYQMMGGLTLIVVNRESLRFNRLSNLNLLSSSTLDPNRKPEAVQLFSGQCYPRQGIKTQN